MARQEIPHVAAERGIVEAKDVASLWFFPRMVFSGTEPAGSRNGNRPASSTGLSILPGNASD